MTKDRNFSNSLKIAIFGLKSAFKEERNFRIQFVIATIVVILMIVLGLSYIEKSIVLLTILVVLSLELINSQIEKFLSGRLIH